MGGQAISGRSCGRYPTARLRRRGRPGHAVRPQRHRRAAVQVGNQGDPIAGGCHAALCLVAGAEPRPTRRHSSSPEAPAPAPSPRRRDGDRARRTVRHVDAGHLEAPAGVLERGGLMSRSRQAQFHPCPLEREPLDAALGLIKEARRVWQERLDKLDAHLCELQRTNPTEREETSKRIVALRPFRPRHRVGLGPPARPSALVHQLATPATSRLAVSRYRRRAAGHHARGLVSRSPVAAAGRPIGTAAARGVPTRTRCTAFAGGNAGKPSP